MTQRETVLGSATFLVVIVAGFFSATWVTRHYAAVSPTAQGTACVGTDGSWKKLGLGERARAFAEMRMISTGPPIRATFN